MDNPKIEWISKAGRDCLKFTFREKFTEQDAAASLDKWRQAFAGQAQKVPLIWDCLAMNDYDHEARTIWQNACKDMKDNIDVIWVITNSILIRMGASVISVFTSLKIKVVSSESDIHL
jgi:hypothetical protein